VVSWERERHCNRDKCIKEVEKVIEQLFDENFQDNFNANELNRLRELGAKKWKLLNYREVERRITI